MHITIATYHTTDSFTALMLYAHFYNFVHWCFHSGRGKHTAKTAKIYIN